MLLYVEDIWAREWIVGCSSVVVCIRVIPVLGPFHWMQKLSCCETGRSTVYHFSLCVRTKPASVLIALLVSLITRDFWNWALATHLPLVWCLPADGMLLHEILRWLPKLISCYGCNRLEFHKLDNPYVVRLGPELFQVLECLHRLCWLSIPRSKLEIQISPKF